MSALRCRFASLRRRLSGWLLRLCSSRRQPEPDEHEQIRRDLIERVIMPPKF